MVTANDTPSTAPGEARSRTLACRRAASNEEIQAYYAIRKKFFVDDQGLFEASDVEPIDHDPRTIHIVAACSPPGDVIGVVRCYPGADGVWFGGRLAVVQEYRASRLLVGRALVRTAEELVREQGVEVFLGHIQLPTVRFFEHIGWVKVGEPQEYAGRLHQLMRPGWSPEPKLR
jgi:putative N-acetyltransferase, MSMEG_0567 N-terminal domain family